MSLNETTPEKYTRVPTGKYKTGCASKGTSGLFTEKIQTCVALVGKDQKTGVAFIWHLNIFCSVGNLSKLIKKLETENHDLTGFKLYCRYGWGPGQIMLCLLFSVLFAAVFLPNLDDKFAWSGDNFNYKALVVGALFAGFIAFQARAAVWGGLLRMKFVHGSTFAGYPESLGHTPKLLFFKPTGVRISTHPNQEPEVS